ncbi:hypothetical protein CYMTET_26468 [Cymbomonas tetramitiformis]|uniref:Uncharacterized protein n=1 Tax=Cymbomonas tetramitiformis TaxID=36881 RepID=A0AAE0KY07_9CHLO|nr:hypothetical protein CYMTET_26468 [Cymbomonas tetramitiformis]
MAKGHVALAWAVVTAASLSTVLGVVALLLFKKKLAANNAFITWMLGLSSGVMLYVCVAELFGKAEEQFTDDGLDEQHAKLWTTLSFFSGAIIMCILHLYAEFDGIGDLVASVSENSDATSVPSRLDEQGKSPIDQSGIEVEVGAKTNVEPSADIEMSAMESSVEEGFNESSETQQEKKRMYRLGLKTAAAVSLHNLPEGLASYVTTYMDGRTGLAISFGIILHNIPEGLVVGAPIYYGTGSARIALQWAFLSGLAEFLGGFVGYLLTSNGDTMNGSVYGFLYAFVTGVVTFIVATEFLPAAANCDRSKRKINFLVSFLVGAGVIAITLVLEGF